MLVEPRKLNSAAEVRANVRKTQDYLKSLRAPPPDPPVFELTPPEPLPECRTEAGDPRIEAVVEAVGNRFKLSKYELFHRLDGDTNAARQIIAGVCILHLGIPFDEVAKHLHVPAEAVRVAIAELTPVYIRQMVPADAAAEYVAGMFCARWLHLAADEQVGFTIDSIVRAVCLEFNLPRAELVSQRRAKLVVIPRHIAIALIRRLTLRSFPEIGRRFGGRDHTTTLHAWHKYEPHIKAAERELRYGASLQEWVAAVRKSVEAAR